MSMVKRFGTVLSVCTLIWSLAGGVAFGGGDVSVVVEFNEAQGQLPEGVAVNQDGDVFVGLAPLGLILRIEAGASQPQPFAQIQGITPFTDFGLLGLEVDNDGNLVAAVQSSNPAANGVWIFDASTGAGTRIDGTQVIGWAYDVAFDNRGNLYITDSIFGLIWQVPKGGSLTPWLAHPSLAGTGAAGLGVPLGANAIDFYKGKLYVTNWEKATVLAVPVRTDGTPGELKHLADLPGNIPAPGGVVVDTNGDIYVAITSQSRILRLEQGGSFELIAGDDPLDSPTSMAFDRTQDEFKSLYVANFSIGELFGETIPREGPSLVRIDLEKRDVASVKAGNQQLRVWVADEAGEQSLGLRGMTRLPVNIDGMLFVYDEASLPTFTNQGVPAPLDLWWFNDSGVLIGTNRMEACPTAPCPSFPAPGPVKWVLETPAASLSLQLGDLITIRAAAP